jgi:hypothetical protein
VSRLFFISGVFVAVPVPPSWAVKHLADALLVASNPHASGYGFAAGDLLVTVAWGWQVAVPDVGSRKPIGLRTIRLGSDASGHPSAIGTVARGALQWLLRLSTVGAGRLAQRRHAWTHVWPPRGVGEVRLIHCGC